MLLYSVTIPQLDALLSAVKNVPAVVAAETKRAINRSLISLQSSAKQLAPVDTGTLRASIQVTPARDISGGWAGKVGTGLNYAIFQEAGTGIYGPLHQPIVAKNGQAMRFQIGGRWITAKSVKGVRARYYMKQSLEQNNLEIQNNFVVALREVAAAISRGGHV